MLKMIAFAAAAFVLSGCAALNSVRNEVSTYGPWPAGRKPATFTFERLPSQQTHPERQQVLEDAARGALEAAGFRAAADASSAEYLMQIGVRVTSKDPWIYNDPLFWRGGFRYGLGYGPWTQRWGPGWQFGFESSSSFEREVALLIRDRKTGQLLYEARANNSGPSASVNYLLPAMFRAAMKDFPDTGPNPHNVTVQISTQ